MSIHEQYGLPEPRMWVNDTSEPDRYTVTFSVRLDQNFGFEQALLEIMSDCQGRLDALASRCEDTQ